MVWVRTVPAWVTHMASITSSSKFSAMLSCSSVISFSSASKLREYI